MRNLQEIYKVCVQECKNAGIPIRDDKVLSVSITDVKEAYYYGLCRRHKSEMTFEIFISSLFLDENCPLIELKDTIIHELIHTCDKCRSHGKTWMKYANIMNEKYGYELNTHKDLDALFHSEKPILHKYICPKCTSIYNLRTEHLEYNQPNFFLVCPFCRSNYKKVF